VLRGVSADGSVAVGFANFDPNDGGVGFIWDTQHGMRVLRQVLLADYGLSAAAGWDNLEPTGLSGDGLVISGIGFDPEGNQQGWVADLRGGVVICRGDFNHSGNVSVQDIFDYLGAFFSDDPLADFDGQSGVTLQDLFDYLTAFFTGCP
jgi:hypothetical protein